MIALVGIYCLFTAPALVVPSSSLSSVSTQTTQPSRAYSIHAHLSSTETLATLKKVLETDVLEVMGEQEAVNKVGIVGLFILKEMSFNK